MKNKFRSEKFDLYAGHYGIQFVCSLYDGKFDCRDINALRYKMFSRKNAAGEKLPPTLDAIILHLRRANYQCYIWKAACEPQLNLPEPTANGWTITNTGLEMEMTIIAAVPDTIVELVRCQCKKACKSKSCSCRKTNFVCTDACLCNEYNDCEYTEDVYFGSSNDDDNV